MSSLRQHHKKLQALCDLIQFVLGVDVFFVDQRMVALAGTGPYRPNIGTKRPRDSYVDVTLHHGDGQVVIEPRYTSQCYRCEYRQLCPYSMVMCKPIILDRRVKGLIGFLGFSEEQRRIMIEHSSLLTQLSQKLDYIWESEDLDVNGFLSHPGTRRFLNTFDTGIALTTPNWRLLAVNQQAEQLIASGRVDLTAHRDLASPIKNALVTISHNDPNYIITDGRRPAAHIFVVSDQKKQSGLWHGCPLSTPDATTIVGTSPVMIALKEQAAYVAESDSTVLLIGETGVGKELVARFIHQSGGRCMGPFETVNCAAIPDNLFESELFGYAPGAFTGADRKGRTGKFQAAHKGIIFLDEVGRLSLANQSKILRVLEERQVQRLGDNKKTDIDLRVMAATNVDLQKAVRENKFLPDLYYRLMVIPLTVPPLRERPEDVPLLIEYFILQLRGAIPNSDFQGFTKETMRYLKEYSWPGNVRELKNMVEYVMNLIRGRPVKTTDLPPGIRQAAHAARSDQETFAQTELKRISEALETFGYNTQGKRRAAKALGISLSTLYRRLARISPNAYYNKIKDDAP